MSRQALEVKFVIDNPNESDTNEKIATYLFLKAIHMSCYEVIQEEIQGNNKSDN